MSSRETDRGFWFRNSGRALLPADAKAEERLRTVGPNQLVRARIMKPRRIKRHRFFFVTVSNYFDSWPTGHAFQPDNEEHLRAWATVKAGHRTILGERLSQDDGDVIRMADFVEKAMRISREKYSFVTIHNGALVLLSPKSIAFSELDEDAFRPIADSILDVLAAESGIPVGTMIAEKAA